jgi:pectinesterase
MRTMNRRTWLKRAASAAAISALDGDTAFSGAPERGFNCVVDASGVSGADARTPAFRSVTEALEHARLSDAKPYRILVRPGHYREKFEITRPGIDLIGTSRDSTIVTFDAASGLRRADGTEWGTAGSATITLRAVSFRAAHLTIANDFDYPANFAKRPTDATRLASPQAVALMAASGSDCAHFRDVALNGYQDTVFVDAGRSFFDQCSVMGHVDFIFGAGRAYFQACEIVSRPRVGILPEGYVTAPSTLLRDPYGLVFRDCRFVPENDRVRDGQTYLGRPWHPGRTFADGRYADPDAAGAVAILDCWLDRHIARAGWTEMGGVARDGSRITFKPEDARLFEFENHGPGAAPAPGRRQLALQEAGRFAREVVLSGWVPAAFDAPDASSA